MAARFKPLYTEVRAELGKGGVLPPAVEKFQDRLISAVGDAAGRSAPLAAEPTLAETGKIAADFTDIFTFEGFDGVQDFVAAATKSQDCPDI